LSGRTFPEASPEGDLVLLLVTIGLVLASLGLLVLGFVQNALGLIYVSMLCAGVAGLALVVFARLARRRALALAGAGSVATPTVAPTLMVPPGPARDDAGELRNAEKPGNGDHPGDESTLEPSRDVESEADWRDGRGEEVVFPIEDYDDLRVNDILPLLPQLDPDELREVRDREAAGKKRRTVLGRIDELAARLAAPTPPPPAKAAGPTRKQPAPADDLPAPTPAPAVKKTPAPPKAVVAKKAGVARKAAQSGPAAAGRNTAPGDAGEGAAAAHESAIDEAPAAEEATKRTP
jgi:hypothetical protein